MTSASDSQADAWGFLTYAAGRTTRMWKTLDILNGQSA